MAYSLDDERRAQDRLGQISKTSSRRERIRIAERLGYGGTDDSKLRSLRRLTTGTLKKGQYAIVTEYFRPYVTQQQPDAWTGRLPSFSITESYALHSQIMYAAIEGGILTTWEAYLNTEKSQSNLATLFESYNKSIKEKLKQSPNVSGRIEGIAFSLEGAEQLIDLLEMETGQLSAVPRADYGVALVPTKVVYKDGKRQSFQPQTYQRRIPRQRRQEIISFINRSYGQRKRSGSIAS